MNIDYKKNVITIEMMSENYPQVAQNIRLILKKHYIFDLRLSEYFISNFNSKMIIQVKHDDFELVCFLLKMEEQNILDYTHS